MGEHAVVLGASLSGLLAARVLSEFYDRVTVVERDELPDGAQHRRGVPQGRHVHALLASGSEALAELFPGILDELAAAGAVVVTSADLSSFWQELGGHSLRRESGAFAHTLRAYQSTRPFLEGHIRRRLRAYGTVTILDGHDVVDLIAEDGRVVGARIAAHKGGPAVELAADIMVDAMGRAGRTPAFLETRGYGKPAEESTTIHVAYTSQLIRIRPPEPGPRLFLIGTGPGRPVGGALAACEDNNWILTVAGMAGHQPPTAWNEVVDFAAQWAPDAMTAALRRAEPIGEPARYRYPASQWRRYDRMRDFPEGLLVFGDAICSFNPVYGQGMSVAGLEAITLRRCLIDGDRLLSRSFFGASAKIIGAAWQLATAADLSVPEVEGKRTTVTRLSGWYTDRILARCTSDIVLHETFFRVINLVDPPSRLMRPTMLRRVLVPRSRLVTRQSETAALG